MCVFVPAEKPIVGPAHFTPQSSTYHGVFYSQFSFCVFVSIVIFYFSRVFNI